MTTKCSCVICKNEFSSKGIYTHFIRAHTTESKRNSHKGSQKFQLVCSCIDCKLQLSVQNLGQHIKSKHSETSLKICPKCNKKHSKEGTFCSRSCASSRKHSTESRLKRAKTLTKKTTPVICGPYTKLKRCKCLHCGKISLFRNYKGYCNDCEHLYSHNGRAKYWFCFNVFHYPDLFDLSLISEFGFRDSKTNPNGITRDHKISVNEAIRNNYDPYYIRHPLNCELMFFEENNRKKTKCSISYKKLISLVDAYEKMRRRVDSNTPTTSL